MMKLAIGCDHGGYAMKLEIMQHLKEQGHKLIDMGCDSEKSCDYPDYAKPVCEAVRNGEAELGILICGTGIGMSMAANKEPGIRAALCHDVFSAQATRDHNNANILCMGARVIGAGLAIMITDTFVNTSFSNEERHLRRIRKYS